MMIASILIALVAAVHAYLLFLEMFRWEAPRTRKVFGTTAEFAAESRAMAANQGLYNGFLAAGFIYGLWLGATGLSMVTFLLVCVFVAGIYGAITATKFALFAQTIPASAALLALWAGV
jgi:putative membrane protein